MILKHEWNRDRAAVIVALTVELVYRALPDDADAEREQIYSHPMGEIIREVESNQRTARCSWS
jgi:hypothetical protein